MLGKLSLGEDIQPTLQALMETTSTFLFGNLINLMKYSLKQIPLLILGDKGCFQWNLFGEGLGSIMGSIVTALGFIFLAFKAFDRVSGLLSGIPALKTTIKTAHGSLYCNECQSYIGIDIADCRTNCAGLVYFFSN